MPSEWPPAPPAGYQLHDPDYEQPWYVTAVLGVWLVGVVVGVPALLVAVHGPAILGAIVRDVLQPDTATEWTLYLGWVVATLALFIGGHEALHALVGHHFGLRSTVHLDYTSPIEWSPKIITYGAFQSRRESLAIALAPLVVLTPVSIVVLVVAQHLWVIAGAAVIALGNTAGAVGDLASAAVLWHLPDGELVYHDRTGHRQYYTPTRRAGSLVTATTPKHCHERAERSRDPHDEQRDHPKKQDEQ